MSKVSLEDGVFTGLNCTPESRWGEGLTFAALSRLTLKEFYMHVGIGEPDMFLDDGFGELAQAMKRRKARFADCTADEFEASLFQTGRWGMSRGVFQKAKTCNIMSARLLAALTDEELLDLHGIGPDTLKVLRVAQARYESGQK